MDTPTDTRASRAHRYAAALRTVAAFYDANPEAPLPSVPDKLSVYTHKRDEFIATCRALGVDRIEERGSYVDGVRDLGDISIVVSCDRMYIREQRMQPSLSVEELQVLDAAIRAELAEASA